MDVIVKYWRLSGEDHRCPKCGSRTRLLISEHEEQKTILRERCIDISCDWEKEICDEKENG